VGAAIAPGALAKEASPPANPDANRIVNGGAEAGLSGWEGSGWIVNQDWHAEPPAPIFFVHGNLETGPVFEATSGGATLTQTDNLSDLAEAIEAGTQELWVEGDFGGSGTGTDGVGLTVQLLDAAGGPVGDPYEYGPPTREDRLNATLIVPCSGTINVPPGVRAARITLQAAGPTGQPSTGVAGSLALYSTPVGWPAIGIKPPPGRYVFFGESGGQGPNCGYATLVTIPGPESPPTSSDPTSPTTSEQVLSLSKITLTRSHVSLWVSKAATINVTIKSSHVGKHARKSAARRIVKLTLIAHAPGSITRDFQHRLRPGRYQLSLSAVTPGQQPSTPVRLSRSLSVH
jgi:hypothetical protein